MLEERSAILQFADIIAKEIIEGKIKADDAVLILRGLADHKDLIKDADGITKLDLKKEIVDLLLEGVSSYSNGRLDPVDIIKILKEGKDVYEAIKQSIKQN